MCVFISSSVFFISRSLIGLLMFQVNPQFESLAAAAPPVRRGRRKCHSATSVLDRCSQVSRKNSVSKFPSLAFQTGARDKSHKSRSTSTKTGEECTVLPKAGNPPLGSCQSKSTDLSGRRLEAQKKKLFTKRNASLVKCGDRPGAQPSELTNRCRVPAEGASTPGTTEVSSVSPPPDVDTPDIMQAEGSYLSSPTAHFLLAHPRTPPSNRPHILVNDTPERDYGLKVTWRRRKNLMLMLKDRGHLSESDALIRS